MKMLDWSPQTDAPLEGITPQQAEQRVRETVGAALLIAYADAGLEVALHFKTVGAMRLGDRDYYVVHGRYDPDAPAGDMGGTHVNAVSLDGRLVFNQSMVHGEWFLWEDVQQEIITP